MTYIDPMRKVLAHLDRLVAWREGEMPAPVTIEWDLSNRCVLGCQDCHFAHTHTRGPWTSKPRLLPMAFDAGGDLADVRLVKRALGEAARAGVQGVIWSGGGEPTTHPYWLPIMREAHELGLQQGMYTLGGLLTKDTAAELRELAAWVVVSLDCATAEEYAAEKGVPAERFAKACQGLSWLSGGSAVVGASFLLHEGNWQRMGDMLRLGERLGANYITFRPAIQTSPDRPGVCTADRSWITEAENALRRFAAMPNVELDVDRFRQYRDWQSHGYSACHGIRLSTVITPDGRVWLCPQRRGVSGSCIGDLREESFADVWARHPRRWTDFGQCRVMCRLHLTNQVLDTLAQPVTHGAFV